MILLISLATSRFLKYNLTEIDNFTPIEIKLPIINLSSYEKLNKNGLD